MTIPPGLSASARSTRLSPSHAKLRTPVGRTPAQPQASRSLVASTSCLICRRRPGPASLRGLPRTLRRANRRRGGPTDGAKVYDARGRKPRQERTRAGPSSAAPARRDQPLRSPPGAPGCRRHRDPILAPLPWSPPQRAAVPGSRSSRSHGPLDTRGAPPSAARPGRTVPPPRRRPLSPPQRRSHAPAPHSLPATAPFRGSLGDKPRARAKLSADEACPESRVVRSERACPIARRGSRDPLRGRPKRTERRHAPVPPRSTTAGDARLAGPPAHPATTLPAAPPNASRRHPQASIQERHPSRRGRRTRRPAHCSKKRHPRAERAACSATRTSRTIAVPLSAYQPSQASNQSTRRPAAPRHINVSAASARPDRRATGFVDRGARIADLNDFEAVAAVADKLVPAPSPSPPRHGPRSVSRDTRPRAPTTTRARTSIRRHASPSAIAPTIDPLAIAHPATFLAAQRPLPPPNPPHGDGPARSQRQRLAGLPTRRGASSAAVPYRLRLTTRVTHHRGRCELTHPQPVFS